MVKITGFSEVFLCYPMCNELFNEHYVFTRTNVLSLKFRNIVFILIVRRTLWETREIFDGYHEFQFYFQDFMMENIEIDNSENHP